MKKIVLITILLTLLMSVYGQEKWEYSFDIKANINQSFYSDNWNGSEKSSVNWIISGEMSADKQLADWFKSKNSLLMKFGQLYQTEENEEGQQIAGWMEPTKSDDEIDLQLIGLFTLDGWVDPFVSARVQTLFEGSSLRAFDPASVTEVVGVSKDFIGNDSIELTSRLGFALKQHHVYQATTRNDGGLESITNFNFIFPNKTTKLATSFEAYKAFFNSEEDNLLNIDGSKNDDWKEFDIKWTNELSMQIYKNMNFNLYAELLYDKEIDKTGRFKQTSGLSISYKLF